jgi:RimJ/RimL family protein N-acetyltransferase
MEERIIGSDLIFIRKTKIDDIDFVIKSETDSENAQYVGQWSCNEHIKALENPDLLHLIIESSNGEKIGYIIIAGIENKNKSIEFRRIVVTEKGKGYGKEAVRLVKKLAFEKLRSHRLWLDVREKNNRAQYVYRSQGFKDEGKLRESIIYNGNYESLIVMSILETEYERTAIRSGLGK